VTDYQSILDGYRAARIAWLESPVREFTRYRRPGVPFPSALPTHDPRIVQSAVGRTQAVRSTLMNAKEIENLNAIAEKVAGKLGIRATIHLVTPERSEVDTHGPQIKLTVFREFAGQMQERSKHFRSDRADLPTVIEQELEVLASQLG